MPVDDHFFVDSIETRSNETDARSVSSKRSLLKGRIAEALDEITDNGHFTLNDSYRKPKLNNRNQRISVDEIDNTPLENSETVEKKAAKKKIRRSKTPTELIASPVSGKSTISKKSSQSTESIRQLKNKMAVYELMPYEKKYTKEYSRFENMMPLISEESCSSQTCQTTLENDLPTTSPDRYVQTPIASPHSDSGVDYGSQELITDEIYKSNQVAHPKNTFVSSDCYVKLQYIATEERTKSIIGNHFDEPKTNNILDTTERVEDWFNKNITKGNYCCLSPGTIKRRNASCGSDSDVDMSFDQAAVSKCLDDLVNAVCKIVDTPMIEEKVIGKKHAKSVKNMGKISVKVTRLANQTTNTPKVASNMSKTPPKAPKGEMSSINRQSSTMRKRKLFSPKDVCVKDNFETPPFVLEDDNSTNNIATTVACNAVCYKEIAKQRSNSNSSNIKRKRGMNKKFASDSSECSDSNVKKKTVTAKMQKQKHHEDVYEMACDHNEEVITPKSAELIKKSKLQQKRPKMKLRNNAKVETISDNSSSTKCETLFDELKSTVPQQLEVKTVADPAEAACNVSIDSDEFETLDEPNVLGDIDSYQDESTVKNSAVEDEPVKPSRKRIKRNLKNDIEKMRSAGANVDSERDCDDLENIRPAVEEKLSELNPTITHDRSMQNLSPLNIEVVAGQNQANDSVDSNLAYVVKEFLKEKPGNLDSDSDKALKSSPEEFGVEAESPTGININETISDDSNNSTGAISNVQILSDVVIKPAVSDKETESTHAMSSNKLAFSNISVGSREIEMIMQVKSVACLPDSVCPNKDNVHTIELKNSSSIAKTSETDFSEARDDKKVKTVRKQKKNSVSEEIERTEKLSVPRRTIRYFSGIKNKKNLPKNEAASNALNFDTLEEFDIRSLSSAAANMAVSKTDHSSTIQSDKISRAVQINKSETRRSYSSDAETQVFESSFQKMLPPQKIDSVCQTNVVYTVNVSQDKPPNQNDLIPLLDDDMPTFNETSRNKKPKRLNLSCRRKSYKTPEKKTPQHKSTAVTPARKRKSYASHEMNVSKTKACRAAAVVNESDDSYNREIKMQKGKGLSHYDSGLPDSSHDSIKRTTANIIKSTMNRSGFDSTINLSALLKDSSSSGNDDGPPLKLFRKSYFPKKKSAAKVMPMMSFGVSEDESVSEKLSTNDEPVEIVTAKVNPKACSKQSSNETEESSDSEKSSSNDEEKCDEEPEAYTSSNKPVPFDISWIANWKKPILNTRKAVKKPAKKVALKRTAKKAPATSSSESSGQVDSEKQPPVSKPREYHSKAQPSVPKRREPSAAAKRACQRSVLVSAAVTKFQNEVKKAVEVLNETLKSIDF